GADHHAAGLGARRRHARGEPRADHVARRHRARPTAAAWRRYVARAMTARAQQADLVLSGGGALGIGHAGAVSVLQARGYRFPRIAGTSAGSIVGALLAAGISARRLRE